VGRRGDPAGRIAGRPSEEGSFIVNRTLRSKSSMEVSPVVGRLLRLKEAAAVLGTTERHVRRLIDQRSIASVKVGRFLRVPDRALADYIQVHTIPAGPFVPSLMATGGEREA
jgi:excisionase family DNA binding protein